ncbi:DUF1189 domain-containing protein [Clostridium uliginosum]|uniref:DUF1189 domain-containing protein n=1 Tax=Clostridium uliginosum TaxID=119641 RepID=A0A1I1L8H6_9CLOT|nr:DUF1189 domain-containing protein [Clostridium uliginosum]SFC69397.1 Protein of unknown function [Clostridium uliginosum]
MKQKTNFFKKFINSIYNLKEFSEYAKEGFGRAILYVFLMALIVGGIKGAVIGYKVNTEIDNINKSLQSDEYKFSIENGILNMENSPLEFSSNSSLLYIDKDKTLDQVDELRSLTVHNDSNILFLKDGILLNTEINTQKIFYKDILGNNNLNNTNLLVQMSIISKIIIMAIVLYTIFMCFINILINCIFVTVFASFSLIFMKIVMKYSVLYSVSLYAATLPFLFQTVLELIFPNIYLDTMFIVGTLVYVIFILKYIKSEMLDKINSLK